MLMPRIIPCLDVRGGRVVKGVRFAGLRDAGDPAALAARYEAEGADEIVVLDVSATNEERAACAKTIAAVRRELRVPLTVGGGVRTLDDALRLLEVGADRVALNTAAVREPTLIARLAERVGRQCVVVAVDAVARPGGGGWTITVRSGTTTIERDAVAWCVEAAGYGAGEILLTSWDRDGTGLGYDLDLLHAVRAVSDVPVVASGGAREPRDLLAALRAGANAVLAASIFHDECWRIGDVKAFLRNYGTEVRA